MTLNATSLGFKNSFENKLFISACIVQHSFAILDSGCIGVFDPSRDIPWEFPGQGWEEVRGGSEIYQRRHVAECGQSTLDHCSGRVTAKPDIMHSQVSPLRLGTPRSPPNFDTLHSERKREKPAHFYRLTPVSRAVSASSAKSRFNCLQPFVLIRNFVRSLFAISGRL
jgi:hypothetical protein